MCTLQLLTDSVSGADYNHVPIFCHSDYFRTQLSSAVCSNPWSWVGSVIFLDISADIRERVIHQSKQRRLVVPSQNVSFSHKQAKRGRSDILNIMGHMYIHSPWATLNNFIGLVLVWFGLFVHPFSHTCIRLSDSSSV